VGATVTIIEDKNGIGELTQANNPAPSKFPAVTSLFKVRIVRLDRVANSVTWSRRSTGVN